MDITTTAICFGLGAAFAAGLSKTGFPGVSIVGIVFMAFALPDDARLVPGVTLPLLLVGDVIAVTFYRKHTDWSLLLKLFPAVAVGILLGAGLLWWVDNDQFKVILGWLLLALMGLDTVRKIYGMNEMPHQTWFAVSLGALAGFATALGNAAGPVMAIYLIAIGLTKEKFMGCAAWFFFLVNLSKVPIYSGLGLINGQTLLFDLYIVPGMLAGALLGRPLLAIVPQKTFDLLVLVLAALGAAKLAGVDELVMGMFGAG